MLQIGLLAFAIRVLNFVLPYWIWQIIFAIGGNSRNITLTWNRWDAPHYLYIAQHGYSPTGDESNFIVFQPLFPLITKITHFVIPDYEFAGIFISIILFVATAIFFYLIIKQQFNKRLAQRSVFILVLFPTSYFFNAPYTESLFLFLAVLMLYLTSKKMWLQASVALWLAILTKHVGVFLIFPLLFAMYEKRHKKLSSYVMAGLAATAAIGTYLLINYQVLGDPLAFNTILREHWFKTPTLFWKSIWGSWHAAVAWPPTNFSLMIGLAEALPATLAILLIPFVYRLKKPGWFLFYSIYVIFISSTSFLLSTPRYLLIAFPLFVVIAKLTDKYKWSFYLWMIVSISLLSFFSMQFISGQWAF